MHRVTRHTLIAYALIGLECLLSFACLFAVFMTSGVELLSALLAAPLLTLLTMICFHLLDGDWCCSESSHSVTR